MSQLARHQALLALVAVSVLFTNLGVPSLWDEDEPKNAECAREMLARGDWIVPTFNEELRLDKPVLIYWFMMTAYRLFGVNEFAARVSSAVLALGTVLLTFHIGRRLFGPRSGLWAGIILASSMMFVVAGRAATPDSSLIFCTTLSLWAFVRFTRCWDNIDQPTVAVDWRSMMPATWLGFVAVYAAMGVGVLAKGPVAVALPTGVIGLFLLAWRNAAEQPESRWRQLWHWLSPARIVQIAWTMRPLTAVLVVGAIALPWYVAVGIETNGDWVAGFLGKHNVGRFLKPMEGHKGPIFYYVPAIMAGFFPWSVFLPSGLIVLARRARQQAAGRASLAFAASWAGLYVIFFSFSGTKLPSYVLPAYPALALLTAAFVEHWLSAAPGALGRWWLRLAIGAIGLAGVGLAVGLPIAAHFVMPGDAWLGLVGAVPLLGAALAYWFAETQRPLQAARCVAATAVVLATVLFGWIAPRVSRHQNSPVLVATARQAQAGPAQLATYDYNVPSLVFYAGERVERFGHADDVGKFFRESSNPYLITNAKYLETLRPALPPDVEVLLRQRRFLRSSEVVLLGRPVHVARAAAGKAR